MIGMVGLYLVAGEYTKKVSPTLEQFGKKYLPMQPLPKSREWYWVELMYAYKNGKPIPGKIFPAPLQKGGKYEKWNRWLSRLLCEPNKRISFGRAYNEWDFMTGGENEIK